MYKLEESSETDNKCDSAAPKPADFTNNPDVLYATRMICSRIMMMWVTSSGNRAKNWYSRLEKISLHYHFGRISA